MPLGRYFVGVGAVLLVLLLAVDWLRPTNPDRAVSTIGQSSVATIDRIRSDRKWPEKVEFDTSAATVTPPPAVPPTASAAAPDVAAATARLPADAHAELAPATAPPPAVKPPAKKHAKVHRRSPRPFGQTWVAVNPGWSWDW